MTDARAAAVDVEALVSNSDPSSRSAAVALSALTSADPDSRTAAVAAQVLVKPPAGPAAHSTSVAIEVLSPAITSADSWLATIGVEVLVAVDSEPVPEEPDPPSTTGPGWFTPPIIPSSDWKKSDQAYTVWYKDGAYSQKRTPGYRETLGSEVIYVGGHIYPVDATEAARLRAAGYTVTPQESTGYGYGYGPYGSGPYGGSIA